MLRSDHSLVAPGDAVANQPTPTAVVRVDQVGYLPTDTKHAYVMANHRVRHATWDVVNSANHVVAHGTVGTTNRGPWNSNYPDVYDITFSGLGALGTYHLDVHGDASAQSPPFAIESAASLYGQVVLDGVNFYQVQRDGSDVVPRSTESAASSPERRARNGLPNP